MLFTTATFAFVYLPIVLVGFFLCGRRSPVLAAFWLFAASVFFYGYWMPEFTLLLLGSIGANFFIGQRIGGAQGQARRAWLATGIVLNLGALAYFKYANFFIDNLDALLGVDWKIGRVVLPIGISFYTFTQIAYLVDTWQGKVREARPVHYGLFVTYFPHLIAGPVLHHAQMMPQFGDARVYRFDGAHFAAGMAIFCIGLFKKVVLADGIAPYADAVFAPIDTGAHASAAEAWIGALAYTFQLYFDFSGYSDMAIGLSWMFNIRLPFNFDSPYKALSISDFWRRWHISLSTFLRDYLYVPLGGNRKGRIRRYLNLGITMVLGGLWHGASWSFVLWGTLHGVYLMANHAFRAITEALGWRPALDASLAFRAVAWLATFLAVVIAWVFFRAETLPGAMRMLQSMVGRAPADVDAGLLLWNAGLKPAVAIGWCAVLGAAAVLLHNSNHIGTRLLQWMDARPAWRPVLAGAAIAGAVALVIVNTTRSSVSAFIYFNF
ncbi:MBOAT family O-acyltransferase [Pseudorhodoferax sp.]|uniref:MBOAT family O-acyltransferase n=1 Tax=Pseudorhodoferax sp. TaxID=1993553 RepID=UPI0039E45CA4